MSLEAGIQNLRCSGWTVRETSSLLDLQRQSEVLMTSILSAAEWLWRRDTATASPVESNRTTPTRSERHTYMFKVDMFYNYKPSSVLVSKHKYPFFYTVYNFVFILSFQITSSRPSTVLVLSLPWLCFGPFLYLLIFSFGYVIVGRGTDNDNSLTCFPGYRCWFAVDPCSLSQFVSVVKGWMWIYMLLKHDD